MSAHQVQFGSVLQFCASGVFHSFSADRLASVHISHCLFGTEGFSIFVSNPHLLVCRSF